LIKEGLLKKIRETPKSTLLSFELTEKGFDAFNFSNDRIKADREIMSVLSEEERQQLISMLNKIITKAETHRNSI
jgi:DNA-binding MarR family transcriptional regulator